MSSTGDMLTGQGTSSDPARPDARRSERRGRVSPNRKSTRTTNRIPDTVESALLDRDGVIVAVNQAWQDFSSENGGDPARTGVGVSYLAICDAAAGDPTVRHVAAVIRAAVRGDLPAAVRVRIPCHAPRKRRWFDILISSRLDDWGVCIGATLTVSPAPPPSKAGPAELDRSSPWRTFDLVPDPVFVLDSDVRVEYANPVAQELLGYAEDEFIGLSLADLDPALDPRAATSDFEQLTGPGSMQVMTCDMRRKDGSLVPVEAHVRSTTTDGAGARRYVVVSRDLRPRRHQDALLRAGEESFQVAFERAPVGMAVIALGERGRHVILRANHALADFLGEPVDHLIGRDLSAYGTVDDADSHRAMVADLMSGGVAAYARHRRFRRADGSSRWAEVRVSQVDFPGVRGLTMLAHLLDVTEQHETERRRALETAMTAAVAEITTSVLAGIPLHAVYQLIADATARVFGAENVTVGLPDPVTGVLRLVAAFGPAANRLFTGEARVSQEFARRLVRLGSVALPEAEPEIPEDIRAMLGPAAATRFGEPKPAGGLITMARPRGAEPFSEAEVAALTALAQQVALAVELGQARAAQQRLAVLEDRQRIARDLHDTVIQDLIAVGMQLDTGLQREQDPHRRRRDGALIDHLEEAVRRLRGSVFDLREPAQYGDVATAVRAVATEAARVLGHTPSVRVDGPTETVPQLIGDAIVAVTREGLSNVARHARATATDITLTVDRERICLVIEDDGRGLPARMMTGDGIANIGHRAKALRGDAAVESRPAGRTRQAGVTRLTTGTRLSWSCPLPRGGGASDLEHHSQAH